MTLPDFKTSFAQLDSERGKIVYAVHAEKTVRAIDTARIVCAKLENVRLQKTIFENLSAPLAAVGTPWEIARERIEREQRFWFENDLPAAENCAETVDTGTLAIACACAMKTDESALAVPDYLLSAPVLEKLRQRARAEDFPVIIFGDLFSKSLELGADLVAVFHGENELQAGTPEEVFRAPATLSIAQKAHASEKNVFSGTLLGAGAGEFFADAAGTQIHGRLCGNDEDATAGDALRIFLPPEIFHLDAFPPEENAFELGDGGEIAFDGRLFVREFATKTSPVFLRIAAQHRQTLESPEGAPLFAWFFPEDALGFLEAKKRESF